MIQILQKSLQPDAEVQESGQVHAFILHHQHHLHRELGPDNALGLRGPILHPVPRQHQGDPHHHRPLPHDDHQAAEPLDLHPPEQGVQGCG